MKTIIFAAATVVSFSAFAGTFETPEKMIENVSFSTLSEIKKNPGVLEDRKKLMPILEHNVVPHFDFQAMTRTACGRSCSSSSPEEVRELSEAFKHLLIATYARSLSGDGYEAQVKIKSGKKIDEAIRSVKTEVALPGKKPVGVDYVVEDRNGRYLVTDVIVEGISIVVNYRDTFKSEISRAGVRGLIQALDNKSGR